MFDASAKIPTSLLNLDVFWTGSYDECYSDSTIADIFLRPKTSIPPVDPRYCLVVIPLPIPGSTAVIIPHATSCSGHAMFYYSL